MAPIARETASMSALTKFSVTGVPRARDVGTAASSGFDAAVSAGASTGAALRGAAWTRGVAAAASRAIASEVACRRWRERDSRSMITRSR